MFTLLVNDNHVDNYLNEILAFVYYGLIVNNRQKNTGKIRVFISRTTRNNKPDAIFYSQQRDYTCW